MDSVFVLWHVSQAGVTDQEKLIGVYKTEEDAKAAISRLSRERGFADAPAGFSYDKYQINQDHWAEGFVVDRD